MEAVEALLERLSRAPDFDAPELQAFDSADLLLLDTAHEDDAEQLRRPGEVVVIGDRHGALTLGAAALGATAIRTHQDPLLGERALAANAERVGFEGRFTSMPLDEALLSDARVVLVQLPRGLEALEEIAWAIAAWADPSVRVYAGGRDKHMSRRMNEVLGRYFGSVSAGLGRRKARVLTAALPSSSGSDAGPAPFPRRGDDPDLAFPLFAHGATFGGPTLDRGTRLLLSSLREARPGAQRVVDVGCGNGVIAVSAALQRPGARVIATDQSSAAVAATLATARAAGVADRVRVHRADALEAVPDGWAQLILMNPPFHSGAIVHSGVGHRLIAACRAAMEIGGELRVVFNSHLRYRPILEREVGPVRQIARDRTFTVLSATRSA